MYCTRDGHTYYGKKVLEGFLQWAATNIVCQKYINSPAWKTQPLWKRLQTLQKLGNGTGKLTIWRERRGVHAKESQAIATCKIRGLRRKRANLKPKPVNKWGTYMVNWVWNRYGMELSKDQQIALRGAINANGDSVRVDGLRLNIQDYIAVLKPKKFRMPQMEYRVAGEAPAPGHPQVGIWR